MRPNLPSTPPFHRLKVCSVLLTVYQQKVPLFSNPSISLLFSPMPYLKSYCFIKTSLLFPHCPLDCQLPFLRYPCHLGSGNGVQSFYLPIAEIRLSIFLSTPISPPGFLSPGNNRNINQIFQVKTLALNLDILLQSFQHSVHQKNLPILSQKHIPTLCCSLQLYHHNYKPSHFNSVLTSFPPHSLSMVHLPTVVIYLLNECDVTFLCSLKLIKSFIPCLTLQILA